MPLAGDVSRVERKYHITAYQAEALIARLKQILPGDDVNGYEPYMVRSLYYDSYYNDDYHDKLAGIKDRKKIRVRIYDPDAKVAKLEVKQKEGENQRKRSILITREEANRLKNGDCAFLLEKEDELAQEVYYIFRKETYLPKCVVEYKRRAFAVKTNDIRITFDSEISTSEGNFDIFNAGDALLNPIENRNLVIMEVKYNHFLLSYIKDALGGFDVIEESYSKYITARRLGLN